MDDFVKVEYAAPGDLAPWMKLVRKVSWNFPGLETEETLQEHAQTVLLFLQKRQGICVKDGNNIVGVLLFSTEYNMICFLAVDPDYRQKGIASALLEKAISNLDRNEDITVSTFREEDEKGPAPRALYRKFGFEEGKLTVEFGYPNQVFILKAIT